MCVGGGGREGGEEWRRKVAVRGVVSSFGEAEGGGEVEWGGEWRGGGVKGGTFLIKYRSSGRELVFHFFFLSYMCNRVFDLFSFCQFFHLILFFFISHGFLL